MPNIKEYEHVDYVAYQLKDGKTVHFVLTRDKFPVFYIYIDDVMIVQNDRVNQDHIDAIFGKADSYRS